MNNTGWNSWYAEARLRMRFVYLRVRVPVDRWKEFYAMGLSTKEATRQANLRGYGKELVDEDNKGN